MAGRGGRTSTSGQGRKKGVPNKATAAAREAIARFVDDNAGRMQAWLDAVAKDDPEKAFQLLNSVIEYHVPKLARTEVAHSGKVIVQDFLNNLPEKE